jgi:multisubunit Na+/H+ antiporter MnhB subunit
VNERRKDPARSPSERRERRIAVAVGLGVVATTALVVFLVRPRPPSIPSVTTTTFAPTTSTTSPSSTSAPTP